MSIMDALISLVAPYECLGCGAEGPLLCRSCTELLPELPPHCYLCRKLSPDSLTCTSCRPTSHLKRVQAATTYEGIAKDMVWRLKFGAAQSLAKVMASAMIPLLPDAPVYIVPVPTATSRIRQRGYDQATLLAKELSRQTGLSLACLLARSGQAHQVGANRQQRLKQLAGAFRVTKSKLVQEAHIILIDDVVTTGATLEAAASVLRQAGAVRIEAIVFAQPDVV